MSLKIDEEKLCADRQRQIIKLFNRRRHIRCGITSLNLIFESKDQYEIEGDISKIDSFPGHDNLTQKNRSQL
jgi:hypothetical protein